MAHAMGYRSLAAPRLLMRASLGLSIVLQHLNLKRQTEVCRTFAPLTARSNLRHTTLLAGRHEIEISQTMRSQVE